MENIKSYINKNFTAFDMFITLIVLGFVFYFLNRTPEQFAVMFYDGEKDPRQKTNKGVFDWIFSSPKSVF